jgi:glycosyltransferase involved in cell wall biosynthesis
MKGPIRVLYFIGDLGTGGSESHLSKLLLELNPRRVEASLMLFHARGIFLDSVLRKGIPVIELGYEPTIGGVARAVRRIRQRVSELRPDVLHLYSFSCQLFAALGTLGLSGHVRVSSRRGNEPNRRRRLLYRLTDFRMDRVLSVSRATQSYAMRTEGLPARKCAVIPNGIVLPGASARSPDRRKIAQVGTLGRLRAIKGSDLMIEAFSLLERPDLHLHMGGPADRAWGRELMERHRSRPGITFHGEVAPAEFLPTLDLFVLPSRSEGMSNALLEAMALGLPVVATDVGGNAEVLDGGRAGVLVEPTAGSIAEGVRSLLDDPDRAFRLGQLARQRVIDEYSLEAMIARYHQVYEEIVSDGGERSQRARALGG